LQGSLFTQDFLFEGITETKAWQDLDPGSVKLFRDSLSDIFSSFPINEEPNESTTERDLIEKILGALDWHDSLTQQSAGRARSDVPDYLLFADAAAKTAANKERQPARRYLHGLSILEAKRWQRPLDRGREPDLLDDDVPSTQMLRYMSRAEIASEKRVQWGVLTNGRHWRLYFQGARSRSEEFLELDLPIIAGIKGVECDLFSPASERCEHLLKVFLLMFRREAFSPSADDTRSFHRIALDEGRLWEARVAEDLSGLVFKDIFPTLVRSIASHDKSAPNPLTRAYLDEVRVAALTLLYRLLFVFYAEDRNLLPTHDARYDDYALRRTRERIRDGIDKRDTLSRTQGRYHATLKQLFASIHSGDEALGLPPYNGGLFDPANHPILDRVTIPDAELAPAIDALSRRSEGEVRKWINYRDLSVQQLGSIYERLLEYVVVTDRSGAIGIQPNVFARKTSGSYYTHQDLVTLIIERSLEPLLGERRKAFLSKAQALASSRKPRDERLAELRALDFATAILDLKVCDPAMGSGHFLVSLVDYLADAILEAMTEAAAEVAWADLKAPYRSPLTDRIAAIRRRILDLAHSSHWSIKEEQLDDRHIVRRMILKRCVYGVDKNPMAVELAKVSLWLHTFTVGAPLSFLDHHLRCGDSLYGEWVGGAMRELSDHYALLINPYVQQARNAITGMRRVEEMTDADITEVRDSSTAFSAVTADTDPLRRFLDFRHSLRWFGLHGLDRRKADPALLAILDGSLGDPFKLIAGEIQIDPVEDRIDDGFLSLPGVEAPKHRKRGAINQRAADLRRKASEILAETRAVAERERFLHWEVAFPGVWRNWESSSPDGGFDAVIGNPPWDRIKLQEVEWFAARKPEIAHATRASDRRQMIAALEQSSDQLWNDYLLAKDQAENMAQVARENGDYPLLSSGDINIYSLFVERAHRLIHREGMVGLLTPSGIASDLGASRFFRSISTTGRLAALFDFENKKVFFPDIHASFKFCTYVASGEQRTFEGSDCAFYLHGVAELGDPDRRFMLRAENFARVNPNTGTAPVFRTRRDAAITTAIYSRVPVLVDRRTDPPAEVWPIRYFTMFHMTNDAGQFKTTKELEADGFYPVEGNRYRRAKEEFVPLYEGKMVQAYDHRAASVVVDPKNLNRPAQPEPATLKQHSDPTWAPAPQFWVAQPNVEIATDTAILTSRVEKYMT
jgi:hypothetical protein